jgi:5S rRNA maturation endonuclease (ribonuclease M5)
MTDLSMYTLDNIKRSRSFLVQALTDSGAVFKGNSCKCPFHDDHTPSAAIGEKEGIWLFCCHTPSCGVSGTVIDILAKIEGTDPKEIVKRCKPKDGYSSKNTKTASSTKKPLIVNSLADAHNHYCEGVNQLECEHRYLNAAGDVVYYAMRYRQPDGKKKIGPITPVGGRYQIGCGLTPRPLYHLPEVLSSKLIIVCEGEKKSDIVQRYGFTATTSPFGAKSSHLADWTPIRNKKVIVWPDADNDGDYYAKKVIDIISRQENDISILIPEELGLTDTQDADDYIQRMIDSGGTSEQITENLEYIFREATPCNPSSGLMNELEDIIAGKLDPPTSPFRTLATLSQMLQPKTVTMVCGKANSGKSLFVTQTLLDWVKKNHRFATIMLEDSKEYHLHRAMAQLEGSACYFSKDWIKEHPDETRATYRKHQTLLSKLALHLWQMPLKQMTYNDILAWVKSRLDEGNLSIVIDPITIVSNEDRPWVADPAFLDSFKKMMTEYSASGMIVTHPRKGSISPNLDDLCGGASWSRFSHVVIWLNMFDDNGKNVTIENNAGGVYLGDDVVFAQAVAMILKSRSGSGRGKKIALSFKELLFTELGPIAPKEKPKNEDDNE